MGTTPIHFAVVALPLTLMLILTLCVNTHKYIENPSLSGDADANANALCERAISVLIQPTIPQPLLSST